MVHEQDSFTQKCEAKQRAKHFREKGAYSKDRENCRLSVSALMDVLMIEAVKHCKHHCSDLFLFWNAFLNHIKDGTLESSSELFGFRAEGVDNAEEIYSKATAPAVYGNAEDIYSAVWRLDTSVEENGQISLDLYQVSFPDMGKSRQQGRRAA